MAKHTEGEWSVQELEQGHNGYEDWSTFCVRDEKNHCLAVIGDVDRATSPHNKANAQLIAAAPELLEVLQGLFEHCAMIHKQWGDGNNQAEADAAIKAAQAAINKAGGIA